MTFLSSEQIAAIKAVRQRAWNLPFTVEHVSDVEPTGYYSETEVVARSYVLSGDYLWRDTSEKRGTPGGMVDKADLILATDIANAETLLFSGARLIIEGTALAITSVNKLPESSECIVTATKSS